MIKLHSCVDLILTSRPVATFVLRSHFCDWWRNAAVERMRRTVICRNLCQRTFRHWESLWASSVDYDECFAHLDYASD